MNTILVSAVLGAAFGACAGLADPTASAVGVGAAIAFSAAFGGWVGASIVDIRARLRHGHR